MITKNCRSMFFSARFLALSSGMGLISNSKCRIFHTSRNSLFPEPGRVHFAEGINPGVEDRRFHVYFRPLRGEILAKADVKSKVEVAGPEVDAVIPSQRHLVHIFVENLKTTVLDEPLEENFENPRAISSCFYRR